MIDWEREREEIVKILLYIFDNIQINFDILIKIERGERITKKDLTLDGFNVKSGGQGYLGKYTKHNRNGNQIVIAEFGTAGLVQWENNKFWANDVCLTLKLNNELINEKFLFYFLKSRQHNIFENNIKAVPEKLNKQFLNNLKLVVPKLKTQNKIAYVL
ncbi:restriction endonuclease subunit S, partial [Mycoplasmopsis gallinarum]|uniref:restriction endonuclease subunit S n=1 Tax=Mycoplasmopsis gallinarum TaxID=29557 RepID=UPI0019122A8B